MILITPEDFVSDTEELLRSVHVSVRELRAEAERLCQALKEGDDKELPQTSKRLNNVSDLVRTCQKLESNLVEHHRNKAGVVQGGYAMDLDQARSEIGCRLSRLRTCGRLGGVPERDE